VTIVRLAKPEDDLARIWPVQGALRLNRQQVLVAEDDKTGEIQGGVLLFDAGHEVVWVAEVTPIVEDGRRFVYKHMVDALISWSAGRAKLLLFLAPEPLYQAQALRCGATFIQNSAVMAMRLGD
jgi:hypothetical protein